jgi:hypothetical protein
MRVRTLPDIQPGVMRVAAMTDDEILLGIRAEVEKLEAESSDVVSMIEAIHVPHEFHRTPGIVEVGSTGRPSGFEDCPYRHDTRREDPFWRAKRSRARSGVGQTLNGLAQP